MTKTARLFIAIAILAFAAGSAKPAQAAGAAQQPKPGSLSESKFDLHDWLIVDETSRWSEAELRIVDRVMRNSLGALAEAGLDGEALMGGYRFRHWAGEFAKDQDGKIAVVNHGDREIVLSDTILRAEYEFFIYHEIGHVINRSSAGRLEANFHGLIEQIEGVVIKHDWTTAEGFWMRGQAHIHRSESIADAFALWVWTGFAGWEIPRFQDMPESARPDAILDVFDAAMYLTF